MALPVLLWLELGLYTSCFVCGIVTAASITIVQGTFGGRCMLYGLVNYNVTAGLIGIESPSSSSLCYFVSAISVMVAVVCFSVTLYWLYTFCIDGEMRRDRMWMNLIIAVSGVFLFFLLITGCVVKIGRDTLCNSIIQNVPNITSCEEAQTRKWVSPIRGGRFYNSLYKAETAVWVNFFLWLIIGVLVIVQKRQGSGSKVIVGGQGGYGGPAGGLFGDAGVTAEETEPFFNQPPKPQ
ncbi:transmembrane protein 179B [Cebidichthys violaceus]|uniref:transmembrane protein 179B n=1 Tax=Cebidichthys violaceus TaxID=271503 RepID=UPI0035CC6483